MSNTLIYSYVDHLAWWRLHQMSWKSEKYLFYYHCSCFLACIIVSLVQHCIKKWVLYICYFSNTKTKPGKITLKLQCFSGKTKPTCQNSPSFEHFQKCPKISKRRSCPQPFNYGDIYGTIISAVCCKLPTLTTANFLGQQHW